MRKGLAILLGTLAFALIGANTFAKAPVIQGCPDVVIGDEEDGLTLDNNWFRYVNAFNLLDCVTDEDSTPSTDLMYVFLEENSYNNLRINDKTQIDAADSDNPAAWGPNEITGFGGTRNFLLTFWDVLRSDPTTQQPNPPYWSDPIDAAGDPVASDTVELLPWQTVEGSPATLGGDKRLVVMFAADEFDNIDTDTLFVMSLNAGFDSLTEQVTTLFEDDMTAGAGTLWAFSTVASLPAATSGQATGTGGYLSIQSGLTATGTLGSWSNLYWARWAQYDGFNGVVPHADGDVMFRANMTLRQDQPETDVTPRIRFGASQAIGFPMAIVNITTPVAGVELPATPETINPQIPAQGVQQNFTSCWSANSSAPGFDDLLWDTGSAIYDLRTWNCFFDVFDNEDSQAGTWFLDNLLVETIPAPAAITPAYSTTNIAGFAVDGGSTGMSQTNNPDGSVTFNDPGATGSVRNFHLISQNTGVDWQGGKTARVSVELSVPDAAARTNAHRFRIRTYTGFWHVSQEWFLMGDDGGSMSLLNMPCMPPVAPATHTYVTYVGSNGGPTPELVALNATIPGVTKLTVALDQLHNVIAGPAPTSGNATATTIHSLTVEMLDIADVY